MKELSPEDVATIIYEAIENENYIKKDKIVPIITATIKCFLKSNTNMVLAHKKDPQLSHQIEKLQAEVRYWLGRVRKLDPENIGTYYTEQTEYLILSGFVQNPPKTKK